MIALSFLIGLLGGLRSLTAPAVTAWAAYLGWLTLDSPLALIGSGLAVGLLSVGALGELVLDKLPFAPNRTDPLGIGARLAGGALTGACVAANAGSSAVLGAVLGAIGGIVGCFAGHRARVGLVKALGVPDIYVALAEDLVAIAGCLWVVSRS